MLYILEWHLLREVGSEGHRLKHLLCDCLRVDSDYLPAIKFFLRGIVLEFRRPHFAWFRHMELLYGSVRCRLKPFVNFLFFIGALHKD